MYMSICCYYYSTIFCYKIYKFKSVLNWLSCYYCFCNDTCIEHKGMVMIKACPNLMPQAEKWKAAWKFDLGIATIVLAGSVKGMFYLSLLLLHTAVKASAVRYEFQLCTLPDSWQRGKICMLQQLGTEMMSGKSTIVTCGRMKVKHILGKNEEFLCTFVIKSWEISSVIHNRSLWCVDKNTAWAAIVLEFLLGNQISSTYLTSTSSKCLGEIR